MNHGEIMKRRMTSDTFEAFTASSWPNGLWWRCCVVADVDGVNSNLAALFVPQATEEELVSKSDAVAAAVIDRGVLNEDEMD
jgi:hypothetical protein